MRQRDELDLFGDRLRTYRAAAGLTQEELAERAGLSRRGIADLERGARRSPHPQTVRRLGMALGLDAGGLAALLAARHSLRPSRGSGFTPLPVPAPSFLGRARELADARRLIQATRLTLVGTGGVGKTRLALEVARNLAADYASGAVLVELAAVADPALVVRAVASAVGIEEQPDHPLQQTLLAAIRDRAVLVVLDNCEHVVQASAELAEALLDACPNVRILATSREPLGIRAELAWRVPTMSLPPVGQLASIEQVTSADAGRLFLQHAVKARPDFAVTKANAPAIAAICARLDGLPLALELAAARVNLLTVEQIAARLDDLRLLTRGGRTAADRQRTLRGALDWSYNLLSVPEQMLFNRLAVFASGWTMEAAESVCAGDDLPSDEVLDLVGNLVDKSLVGAQARGEATWYSLLFPVRAYALEQLQRSGEELRFRSRHMEWCLQLGEQFGSDWRGPRQRTWFETIEREESNIRAALRGCLDRGDITAGLRLAGALYRYWDLHNRSTEGREWLTALLARATSSTPAVPMAKALGAAGRLATYHGDTAQADAQLGQALRLWCDLANQNGIAHTLIALGSNAQAKHQSATAEVLWRSGLAVARRAGDRLNAYWALHALGRQAAGRGDYACARALHEESLRMKREQHDAFGAASSLSGLAQVAWFCNEYEQARTLLHESLPVLRDLGLWGKVALDLWVLAHVSAACGEPERSVCLFGAVAALRERVGDRRAVSSVLSIDPARVEASLAACRAMLAPVAFQATSSAGAAMTMDEAVTFALATPPYTRRITGAW
jgi:predicted ATPase/DNA-binding XRE family transcriptional regulator